MAEKWQSEQLFEVAALGGTIGDLDGKFAELTKYSIMMMGSDLAGAIQAGDKALMYSPALIEGGKTTHTAGVLFTDRQMIVVRSEGRLRPKTYVEAFERSTISNVTAIRRSPARILEDLDGVSFHTSGRHVEFFLPSEICSQDLTRRVLALLEGTAEVEQEVERGEEPATPTIEA